MDEGPPIAYSVLEDGVSVLSSDGEHVGRIAHVIVDAHEDVFHGLVIDTESGPRFVAADQIAAIHELGVNLAIDAAAAAELPHPHGAVPEYDADTSLRSGTWGRLLDRLSGHKGWRRD